jgi:hypothetical protein
MARYRNTIQSLHGPYGLLRRLSEERFDGELVSAAHQTKEIVEAEIIKRTPRDTGQLQGAISVRVEEDGEHRFRLIAQIDKDEAPYGPLVNAGTGIYGEHHRPIRAKSAYGMRFYWKKMGRRVKFMEVAGQPAQRFMERGWRSGMRKSRKLFSMLLRGN